MSNLTYESLRQRISGSLSAGLREFSATVADIGRNFRSLGLESAVWCPEKIHTTELGGVIADSYFGYSRVEGKWGLVIRTIERDGESRAFVGQRVYTIESCRNPELSINALKKAAELLRLIEKTTNRQIEMLSGLDDEIKKMAQP